VLAAGRLFTTMLIKSDKQKKKTKKENKKKRSRANINNLNK